MPEWKNDEDGVGGKWKQEARKWEMKEGGRMDNNTKLDKNEWPRGGKGRERHHGTGVDEFGGEGGRRGDELVSWECRTGGGE